MTNNFDDVMSKRSDAELLKILKSPEGDYQTAAIEAAKKEFAKRKITDEQVVVVKKEIEFEKKIIDIKANTPLEIELKIVTAIFPGILQLIFSGVYKNKGYDRKGKELAQWTLYGLGFYVGIIILISLL